MLDFIRKARKKLLSFEQLQIVQLIAQQVVLSVEGSVKIPGASKKAIALQLVGELLEEVGVVAPKSLIDTAIEAAVRILKAMDGMGNEVTTIAPLSLRTPKGKFTDVPGAVS